MNAAERHARRILGKLSCAERQAIMSAPKGAVSAQFGLQIREEPALELTRGADGWCDGLSFLDHGVVLYVPTPYSRRENFTIVHELGHKLVEDDDDALDWIADRNDPGRELERLCDRIASELLMPGDLVTEILAGQPPAAAHLQALHAASAASEPVCAIALAQRLPCQGGVIIMDLGGRTVSYASVASPDDDGWPLAYPWPRQEIPDHHRLPRLQPGQSARERSWWQTPWGEQQEYYLDAVTGTRRVHAILATQDLWNASRLHLDAPPTAPGRPAAELHCPCGFHGTARGYPCSECHQPYCPRCRECACPRRRARDLTCQRCGLLVPPAAVVDGVCSECR